MVDSETNFWGMGDRNRLEDLYTKVREDLFQEIKEFRFNSDIILFYVNPTDRCNASCPYCYLPQEIKARRKNMTYQELEKVVEKATAFFDGKGMKGTVVFHGSEPLLNKDNIFKVIDQYHKDLNFGIQTNGLLLQEEDADFIKEKGLNIGISLDSPVEKTNDYLRGEGHYQAVVKALDWFRGYRGLNVVTTITNHNVGQLLDMVRFLHEKEVGLCLMNPVRGTQVSSRSFRPDPLQLASEFIKAVDESIRLTKEGRRIVIGDFANILLGIIAPSARVLMCDISPCGGGRRFFSITADGRAYPCGEFIGMDGFLGGNIFSDSIEDIVASRNFLKVRERVVEEVQECRTCLFKNMCGAPCPAEIYSTEGSMYAKSYYCDFYKKVAEHAFKVIFRDEVEFVIRKTALREMFNLNWA